MKTNEYNSELNNSISTKRAEEFMQFYNSNSVNKTPENQKYTSALKVKYF